MKKVAKKFLLMLPLLICVLVSGFSFSFTTAYAYSSNETYSISKSNIPERGYFNGHYYSFFNDAVNWTEAKTICEELGGHLVTITSQEEDDFCWELYKAAGVKACWLGASDIVTEGVWTWVTNELWDYANWGGAEPNGGTRENYLNFYNDYEDGRWNDCSDTSDEFPFICEWENNPFPYEAKFIETENDYINGALLYDGHLYKLFNDEMSWNAAKQYCSQLGGHLATITNEAEDKQLFKYVNIMGYTDVLLGASDSNQEGVWTWVTGEPFDYTNFNLGEPNNSGNNEDYLEYYTTTGGWNDTNHEETVFLCEWSDTCLVGNELKLNHTYENFSIDEPTCQKEGKTVDKCSRCECLKETKTEIVACKYSSWEVVSGNKLIPPIVKEKHCEWCGDTQQVTDWSFVWLPIVIGVVIILSIVGLINYIKMFKKEK